MVLTSRRDEASTDRSEMFKIRRKSISGSLKKKNKEKETQYLSANPVVPSELNYFEEARKLYKQGKTAEALHLFELTLEKNPEMAEAHYYTALCHLTVHNYEKADSHLTHLLEIKFSRKTVFIFAAIAAKNLEKIEKAIIVLT